MNKYRWRHWPYCSDPGSDRSVWDHQLTLLRQEAVEEAWDGVSALGLALGSVSETVRIPVRESELVSGPASDSVLGLGQVSEWVAASRRHVPNTNYAGQA